MAAPDVAAATEVAESSKKHGGAAEGLADLFFRADNMLSAKDETRANELRRTYRSWRTGSDVQAHPDVLTYQHAMTMDEQRATAKMKRVKTTGDHLNKMADESAWRSGSHNGSPSISQARPALPPCAAPPE